MNAQAVAARPASAKAPQKKPSEAGATPAPAAFLWGGAGKGRAACACGGGCPRCVARPLQAKLDLSRPDDALEREADQVAERVLRMPRPQDPPQGKAGTGPRISRYSAGTAPPQPQALPPVVHEVLQTPGAPLDRETRAFFEPRFERDFQNVQVHTGPRAAQSARALGALAYTAGRHVVFAAGRYSPATTEGRRLMGHELAHVVQQMSAPPGAIQRACPPPEHLGEAAPPRPCVPDDPAVRAADDFSTPLRFCLDSDDLIDEDAGSIPALRSRIELNLLEAGHSVHIHGYASSPGTQAYNDRLACHRAAAIRTLLGLHTRAPIVLHSHGETTAYGEPLQENQRVVVSLDPPPRRRRPVIQGPEIEIIGSAGPLAETSNCETWQTRMVNSHLSDARTWINDAEPKIAAYAAGTASAPVQTVVRDALLTNFHTTAPADVATIAAGFRSLKSALNGAQDIECVGTFWCEPNEVAYVRGASAAVRRLGDINLCPLWFACTNYFLRVATIVHEVSHQYPGTDDYAYEDVAAYATLPAADAMDNAASYATAARQVYHGGRHGPGETCPP
jgi:outer membrane protein OmpA-like peptidoglycan-associated protein